MFTTFYFKKVITALLLPPTSLLLLILLGLGLLAFTRRRKLGLSLGTLGALGLLALSTPLVAFHLSRLVGDATVVDKDRLREAQAIVILGSGLRRNAVEYGTDAPTARTMDRIRYGAVLARASGLPVLVSGGRVFGSGRAEADVMREVLEREFNVPVKWSEGESRNTHENAVFTARILEPATVSKVVLVVHAVDGRRARREFLTAGLDVLLAPTSIPANSNSDTWVQNMPSAAALQSSTVAIYEMLANLALSFSSSG